tara:strand:+ start:177 stop:380 length:204 start_codon:yes stop_codon:yes gene_type:complete
MIFNNNKEIKHESERNILSYYIFTSNRCNLIGKNLNEYKDKHDEKNIIRNSLKKINNKNVNHSILKK